MLHADLPEEIVYNLCFSTPLLYVKWYFNFRNYILLCPAYGPKRNCTGAKWIKYEKTKI